MRKLITLALVAAALPAFAQKSASTDVTASVNIIKGLTIVGTNGALGSYVANGAGDYVFTIGASAITTSANLLAITGNTTVVPKVAVTKDGRYPAEVTVVPATATDVTFTGFGPYPVGPNPMDLTLSPEAAAVDVPLAGTVTIANGKYGEKTLSFAVTATYVGI